MLVSHLIFSSGGRFGSLYPVKGDRKRIFLPAHGWPPQNVPAPADSVRSVIGAPDPVLGSSKVATRGLAAVGSDPVEIEPPGGTKPRAEPTRGATAVGPPVPWAVPASPLVASACTTIGPVVPAGAVNRTSTPRVPPAATSPKRHVARPFEKPEQPP